MKAIVGLGNPGVEYQGTRHNVGFEVVDAVAGRWQARLGSWKGIADVAVVNGRQAILAKPSTFMNLSGEAVQRIAAYHRIEPADVLIVVDEVQLPVGRLRLRRSGSHGGHNGLRSVIQSWGSIDFPRLRIGVGRGDPRWDLADHVLAPFGREERELIARAVDRAADAVELFVDQGIEAAMNGFNAADEAAGGEEIR